MFRKKIVLVVSTLCLLMLILDSKTAVSSAVFGIEQCIHTVIPALFPFFLFSALLVSVLCSTNIPLIAPIAKAAGIPSGAEALFLAGILGGYPVGAHCIAQANRYNGLSDADARRMLGFCVNAGPSFIFGICSGLFSQPLIPLVLWAIHIVSSLLVGILLRGNRRQEEVKLRSANISIADAFRGSILNMAQVCGWIVMYRVLIGFADRWILWLLPEDTRCLIIGCLELTNGCLELLSLPSQGLRFVLCSAFLALGGLCVLMQVQAVTGKLGLGAYIPGKLLQCLFSTLLAIVAQYFLFSPGITLADAAAPAMLLALLLITAVPFSSQYKKSGSISVKNHV